MNSPTPLGRIRIVLSHTSHPGNIGAAARAMQTMGLRRLGLVNPQRFPHQDAITMAAGATDVLDHAAIHDDLTSALTGAALVIGLTARPRQLSHILLTAREAAAQAIQVATQQEVVLLFGTEMSGLSNAELDQCQLLAAIPADSEYSSLNLAAAVQVLCYELRMVAIGPISLEANSSPLAGHDEVEGFYHHLEQTLVEIGYLDPAVPRRLMTRLRRLFSRARLESEEIHILRGILKSIRIARK
jgi:tRNA/rRNA methyltransferase